MWNIERNSFTYAESGWEIEKRSNKNFNGARKINFGGKYNHGGSSLRFKNLRKRIWLWLQLASNQSKLNRRHFCSPIFKRVLGGIEIRINLWRGDRGSSVRRSNSITLNWNWSLRRELGLVYSNWSY